MATIRKRKTKWQVQVRRQGLSPITKTFLRQSDAKEWARHMEVQADRKELPVLGESLARYQVKDILERYRDEIIPKKQCVVSETYHVRKILTYKLASKTLEELSDQDFTQYRDERLKTVKPSTFNRELTIIRHAFNVAKREWGIPLKKNPLESFQKPKVKNERQRRLSTDEYDTLKNAITAPYLWLLVELAIETGMRRGELLNIKEEHIDYKTKTMLIPVTKTGYQRTIPLSSKSLAILQSLKVDKVTGRLFPITANALRLKWERVLRKTKIVDLHFHDLRHEAVSRFFERGLSVPEVALISGHRDYKMLMRYTHIKPESIVDKLN